RTARAPARWPAVRERLRARAQRPLPSMMIATWRPAGEIGKGLFSIKSVSKKKRLLAVASGADQRLHVIQVAVERAPSSLGQAILGARDATVEVFAARDIVRVLQPRGMHAQVSIGRAQQTL